MKKKWIRDAICSGVASKIWKVMRLSVFFLMLFVTQIWAETGYSQQTKLSLKMKNARIIEVLDKIEDSSEFYFLFNQKLVDVERKVNVDVDGKTVAEILSQLFESTDVNYLVKDRQIVLTTEKQGFSIGQQKKVTGKVIDEAGDPLPGVTVLIKGTTNGTVTNADGAYSMVGVTNESVLQFSFVGMVPQEFVVGDQNSINVTLQNDAIGIDEVVAVGYGVSKKSDLTGAVASVKTEDLSKVASVSIGQALQGKAAGLQVVQGSAQPGGGISFLVRGAASTGAGNSPLIVVDGFPVTNFSEPGSGNRYNSGSKSFLNSINPNDIESVEILKDASSTAIYGARAANGVILITTKRGKKGEVKVEYSGSYSVQKPFELVDVLDGDEYMIETNRYLKEKWMYDNQLGIYGGKDEGSVNPFQPRYSDQEIASIGKGTNWVDEISDNGSIQQHNITLTGGTEKSKYFISGNYFDQSGVINTSNLKRFSTRINFDQKLSDYFSTGISFTASSVKSDNVPLGSGAWENSSIIRTALQFLPTVPVKDENGEYAINPLFSSLANPVSMLEISDESKVEKLLSTAYLEFTPIKDLKLKATVGVDRNNGKRYTYLPKTTLYGAREGGRASIAQNEKTDYLFDLIAQYNKEVNEKHSISLLGGYSYQEFNWEGFNANNRIFLLDQALWYNLGGGEAEKPGVGSYGGKDLIASYFGRVNYKFQDKYLLTATFRADGASNFANDNKWGYFPSVALGWRVSEESFFEPIKHTLNYLKARVSYGQTGNSNIGHKAFAAYRTGANFPFGETVATGVYPSQLENPNLKWETSTEFNVGVDFGLWNNRVTGTAEYFNKVVSDLLSTRNIMSYNEISSIAANIGETQSSGVEISLVANVVRSNDFVWNANLTYASYDDRWKERHEDWKPAIFQKVDDPITAIYNYQSDGLIKVGETIPHMPNAIPGTVKIKDIDGFKRDASGNPVVDENGRFVYLGQPDGKLDDADKVLIGKWSPGFTLGFTNQFTYKNFDLSIYVYGMFDRYKVNDTQTFFTAESYRLSEGLNMTSNIIDRWTHDNQDSELLSSLQTFSPYPVGDYYFENASFVRVKNITLGYNVPQSILGNTLSKARIFVDAQNLFVFSGYTGIDPETDSMASYPNQRSFSIGVNLTF